MRISFVFLVLAVFGPGLGAQDNDLYDPTKLRTFKLTFKQAGWWSQLLANQLNETYLRADLEVDKIVYQDIGVRLRGKTALSYPRQRGSKKLPFKISMDAFVPGRKLFDQRSFDLNNGFWTPTFMREIVAFRLMREICPAPRAHHVKLVINNENWGIYINVEPVNKDMLERWFRGGDGPRYQGQSLFRYLGTVLSSYMTTFPLRSAHNSSVYESLIRLLYATSLPTLSEREVEVGNWLDLDATMRVQAANSFVANIDGFPRHNYYIYEDPRTFQFEIAPWDLNLAFFTAGTWTKPIFFGDSPTWTRRYRGYLRNIADRHSKWEEIHKWIVDGQSLIDSEVQADTKKLYTYSMFKGNIMTSYQDVYTSRLIPAFKTGYDNVLRMLQADQSFRQPRVALSDATQSLHSPEHGQSFWVTVRATSSVGIDSVVCMYRSQGPWIEVPAYDDGKHQDGNASDGVYGAELPGQRAGALLEYFFRGETVASQGADVNYLPWNGAHAPIQVRFQPLRNSILISEFLARNEHGIRDSVGDREDWIELVNPTNRAIALDNMYLGNDLDREPKFAFPKGTTLKPGERVLVWADDEPIEGNLHAPFRLDGDGEQIALFGADRKTLLDGVTFGKQRKDVSTGRLYDRDSTWVTYRNPTPRASNEVVCGWRQYGALDSETQPMVLNGSGSYRLGQTLDVVLAGAPANSAVLLLLSAVPGRVELPSLSLTLMAGGPIFATGALQTSAGGAARLSIPLPLNNQLDGASLVFQAFGLVPSGLIASNGLEAIVCK